MLISITDLIRDSFNLCKKNWRTIAPYFGFLLLPLLLNFVVGYIGIKIDVWVGHRLLLTDLIAITTFLINSLFFLLAAIVLNQVLKSLLKKEPLSTKKYLFKNSLKYLWPTIYTGAIVGIAVFIGALLFMVPGLIFFIWFSFASLASPLIIIFENKRGLEAMLISKQLVINRWWSVFFRIIISSLFFVLTTIFIQSIIMWIIKLLPINQLTLNILDTTLSNIFYIISWPFISSALIIFYFNLKENQISISTSTPPPIIPEIKP